MDSDVTKFKKLFLGIGCSVGLSTPAASERAPGRFELASRPDRPSDRRSDGRTDADGDDGPLSRSHETKGSQSIFGLERRRFLTGAYRTFAISLYLLKNYLHVSRQSSFTT